MFNGLTSYQKTSRSPRVLTGSTKRKQGGTLKNWSQKKIPERRNPNVEERNHTTEITHWRSETWNWLSSLLTYMLWGNKVAATQRYGPTKDRTANGRSKKRGNATTQLNDPTASFDSTDQRQLTFPCVGAQEKIELSFECTFNKRFADEDL